MWDKNRELTNIEYSNLSLKANTGALPVEYLRKNLFNATTRTSKELKRYKTIFDDGNAKIQVSRSLHQKHRDVLSILFTDNKGISKPSPDGSYAIYTNLYYLAKEMGYKTAKDAIHLVKGFLYDLRHTDLIYTQDGVEYGHSLIGDYMYNEETGYYAIEIPSKTAKFKILNYAVEVPKEINRKIVAIPNSLAKMKALVSYMLSNQALKNGITFQKVCDKLDIQNENKSRFKKELMNNLEILAEFNITFDQEGQILKYQQMNEIKFHTPVSASQIIAKKTTDDAKELVEPKQIERAAVEVVMSLFVHEELNMNEERYKKNILNAIGHKVYLSEKAYVFLDVSKNSDDQILMHVKEYITGKTAVANTGFTMYEHVYTNFFRGMLQD